MIVSSTWPSLPKLPTAIIVVINEPKLPFESGIRVLPGD
jgi:hypothetical protein